MKIALYTNCVSAHQLPLARALARRVGSDNFVYVEAGEQGEAYQTPTEAEVGVRVMRADAAAEILDACEVLLTGGLRPIDLIERRATRGLKTLYMSERWFKPFGPEGKEKPEGGFWTWVCRFLPVSVPGSVRLLVPGYRRMARRFVAWANGDPHARILTIGPWAKRDFLRLGVRDDRLADWGYFVESGAGGKERLPQRSSSPLRVLWVGRLLRLKRVKDLVRAVGACANARRPTEVALTVVGDGPEKARLMRLARGLPVTFLPGQPMARIREIMREHDTLVMSSNAYEGWGAVVSEALEEGLNVIGTHEAGASAAMLPADRRYAAGDVEALARLLEKEYNNELPPCEIGPWTAEHAADRLLSL